MSIFNYIDVLAVGLNNTQLQKGYVLESSCVTSTNQKKEVHLAIRAMMADLGVQIHNPTLTSLTTHEHPLRTRSETIETMRGEHIRVTLTETKLNEFSLQVSHAES